MLISLTGCLFHSLELELSGELILSLLQLLSAPHVLVVHVLDLGFDALELGIQLRGEKQREGERERWVRRAVAQCSVLTDELVDAMATALEALASGDVGSQ